MHRIPAPCVFAVAAGGGATSAGEDDHEEGDRCGDHELGRPTRLDGCASAEGECPEIEGISVHLELEKIFRLKVIRAVYSYVVHMRASSAVK